MAVKNYLINDKWLDIDKQNIVEIKSTDGVIGSVKLNGEEYGGSGGGGESDFSTAEVTVNSSTSLMYKLELSNYYDYENTGIMSPSIASGDIDGSIILNTILYKGQAMCIFVPISANTPNISVSGNIQDLGQQTYIITGDCTITIS